MKTTKIRQIRKNIILLLTLLVMSIQTTWAQALEKKDLTEVCDFGTGTISFTLPEGNSKCTWKVDGKEINEGITNEKRTLTLKMSQKTDTVEVTYTDASQTSQTLSFEVEPKVYGKEYNGKKFYAEKYARGEGSKEDPYIISTDLELAKLAHDVTNGKSQTMYSGKYFQLSKNINLSKGIWMPIGTLNTDNAGFFGGTLDGDGKTISNMKIYWTTNGSAEASWGLFSRLKGKDENNYATVTNLIIENASLETQKNKLPTGTGTVKIGIVASDLVDFAEVSNIIIRKSKITDYEEKYTAANVCRIGGIIGYLDNQNYRIFNLSSDTEINIHKNATLKKPTSVTVAGAIGCATSWGKSKKNIMPTNLYVHGKKMVTNKAGCTGSVVAFYRPTYQKTYQTQYGETINTWFYTQEVGTNTYSDGNIKEIADFGKEFTDINNNFINDNQLEKKTWTYSSTSKTFSFSSVYLTFKRATTDVLTVMTDAEDVSAEQYDWYATDEKGEWKKVNTETSNTFILPRQDYDQNVYAIGDGARTNAVLVKAIHVNASLATSGNTYTVTVTNDTEEKYSNEYLGLDIKYQWYNGDTELSETSSSFKRPSNASYNDKFSCHVTVKSKSEEKTFLDTRVSATTVVYLDPANGNDNNSGYTKDTPMKTWRGAYSKLSKAGSWDENIIVLMGESSKEVTNNTTNGFNITNNNTGGNILTKEKWDNAKKDSPLFRNVTITGEYGNDKYDASIEITSLDIGLPLWGDTRFENITFKNTSTGTDSYKNIFCQYNNLEMGKGIKMEGFQDNAINYGTIDGAVTTPVQIFGGFSNDGRFYPLNDPKNIKAFEESMPHGEKGFSITIKSGFYSAICVGGRQTIAKDTNGNQLNGVMGTPNLPIKCTITMDIDRAWNNQNNTPRKVTMSDKTKENRANDYDAGIILAGNHEGAMYADVDIIVKSGKVARIVNGTLGAQTEFELPYNNQTYKVPCNTYMGRANILLDPASSVYKKSDDSKEVDNARVVVTELYGGSMGRGHTGSVYINNPFYGNSTITINGGTFKVLPDNNTKKSNILCGIFGAGAGGMNGIGYGKDDAKTHTPDESIAYWNETKDVMLYGPYKDAKRNLVSYHCYNAGNHTYTNVNPLKTNTQIIIKDGIFGSKDKDGEIDGIYAGGSGYMSPGLWTSSGAIPSKTGGNVYGSEGETAAVSLTINGGTFYCKNGIFAGGRGTYWYYSNNPYGAKEGKGQASDYTALGQTYGNVALNINGGIFHCPIFGGGYGVADARLYDTVKDVSTLSEMARIYGKSNVTIYGGTFYQNIYGGGDMAVVENIKKYGNKIIRKDATNVIIGDKANILGSVFAGGKGRKRRLTTPNATTVSTDGFTQLPDSVGKVIGNTNVTFTGSSQQAPSIYGDIYGGGNYAQVDGSTNVNIFAANFAGQIFGGGMGNIKDESGNELSDETKFTSADISGDTNVNLAQDMVGQEEGDDGKPKDSFSINVIWNKIWDAEKNDFIIWYPKETEDKNNTKYFFGKAKEDDANAVAHFLNPHNIYGGGNLACKVKGVATVEVLKGMTPFDLLNTEEWKDSYNNNNFPHFSVFGGGYGEHTTVKDTEVTVNVEGDYSAYDAEVDDDDDTEQMARPHSRRNAAKTTIPVFDNSKGIPNFTILGVLGGGYAGTVTRSSKVTVDGNTFLHRVYGGGFGDPYKDIDNKTGQIGNNKDQDSRTEVFVKGGNIYGDVFGGGAGVAPKTATGTPFTNVARVIGKTIVEISDDAKIYGKVYGGGDMANVGPEDYKQDYSIKPISHSNIKKDTGDIIYDDEINPSYIVDNYRTLVNIIGGDIFGSVFGGGKGLRREAAEHYEQVGRINGNTIVHVANTAATSINSIALDYYGNTVPYVWYNIYGGCAYGTVAGNTLVHIEGGMLGRDVFGGGYGDIAISEENQDTQEVLGEKDTNNKATYANILGNTQVQMDGGTWIWNQNADINGNITTWLAAQGNSQKICNSITEFKEITDDILKAENINDLPEGKAKAAINRILTDKDTQEFFRFTNDKILSGNFKKNNNIYGGGNRACIVGTYTDNATTAEKETGEAIVVINHSPLDDITDKNGKQLSMFDVTTLPGLCWYISAKNVADPQFSVFGAGYGANTKVAKATVYAQPGSHINDDGIIAVDGAKYRYLNQKEDLKTYSAFENSLYEEFKKVDKEEKIKYFGSVDGTDSDPATFRRYRVSRLAWTLGVPGFSFQAIHGGGFSGDVTGNTYVETDCQLFCENIYGAGLGAVPFGEYTKGEGYYFGKVGGKSKIFIKAGFVGQNVYGGGAGVESVKKDGQFIDFPDMASVKETEVHVYGRKLKLKNTNIEVDRTLIIGSVYGGGDVANVGNKNNQNYDANNKDDASHRTTLVNIRGAGIYSQVFAGGKGRLATQCGNVTKLGAIYGNTSLLIDRPIITYPYRTETGGYEDPSSTENMAHPAADINTTMLPLLMEKIYGGCQNGTVYGNTFVTLYDGRIGHGIYGGGLGSCDSIIVNGQDSLAITSADVTGNTNVYIKGGQAMLTSYWLADTRSWEPASIIEGITYSPQYNHQTLKFKINHNIYAGGNIACVVGKDAHLTMEKGLLHDNTQVVYGVNVKFFETMVWKEIYNKVGSPHFCVFGGGYGEHTIIKGDTHVNIAMTGRGSKIDPSIDLKKGEEYKHFWSGYSVMDFVGGGYSGKVEGETYVTGDGGAFCRRLFGGGFYNSVKATHVDIHAMDCRDIFGGGMMGDVEKSTTVNIGTQNLSAASSESTFSNKDIFIHGNVYGGNDVSGYVNVVQKNGNFTDNEGTGTHINIYGGKIDGDVYGAGNGDYLYALDRKGNTQITVNENYPLNPNDPNSETTPLVFTVPMRENMPSHKAASDAAKMVNINSWRPMTNKVNINIKGNSDEDYVLIKGDVYGGGNSATVLKAQKANAQASEQGNDQANDQASSQSGTQTVAQTTETVGSVDIKIGSNVNIRSVFMGCNGEALFTASEDNNFMNKFQKLNGDYYDTSKELDFADSIDWENDPSNKGINTLYLPTENAQRPLIYPHLLDLYFQPVEMNIQGTLQWAENLTNCTIGSFYCGGNRGNMNIYPDEKGKVVDYTFPEGLTITSKIVGGCNNANYDYKGEVTHEGGYLLGTAHSEKPFIKLTIKNKFEPAVVEDAYQGGCVYGGCYKTGTVRGDVTIDLRSDMLAGKDQAKLEKSNEYLATNPEYSSLNIYGAGYGMESYVYGNTRIVMGDSISCTEPAMNNGKFSASGVSANFIYGGGQQGNVIGLTDVDILNGHVFRSVTGGSYSGYVYGSTQVKVGYPTYYKVNELKSGKYILKRTDQKNLDLKNNDGTIETPTIKQEIHLLASELISQGVYDDIVAIENGTRVDITESNKGKYFSKVAAKEPSMGWDNVHINIDEAIYGGGYSLAQGTSVLANNTTVLKLTDDYNVDKAFTNSAEHLEELKSLPRGTTAGFGGNTLILIGDSKTSEHITISKQDMKEINLPNGTDLYGYYYRYYDDNSKDDEYTYRFIYEMVKYYKGDKVPDLEGIRENTFYEYDSEGGIFGDGHLSYAQGFRSADITGYGFANHTIDNPKIINTFQRIDILRLEDNCFSLLGARDYTVNEINKTPYSIARVGEIKMVGNEVKADTDGKLEGEPETQGSTSAKFKYNYKARNFMGLANNIHYVGAVYSNIKFSDTWHDQNGKLAADNITYQNKKQGYIDRYNEKHDISEFQERNNGTAKNMIGIASGYALKIQNVQEIINKTTQKMDEKIYYGPIHGIIEMNLISARPGEGGGYVYADNVHERTAAEGETKHKVDFLETTGNFVFPLNYTNTGNNRFIVDDCSPKGFYSLATDKDPDKEMDIHYWYVTGYNYYYNAHITGYTYKEKIHFDNDNSDGLTALAGLKPRAKVSIKSWKMRSGHPVGDSEQKKNYQCDLEEYAPTQYQLYVGASDTTAFIGATSQDQADKADKGFAAILSMSDKKENDAIYYKTEVFNETIQGGDAKIAFRLYDNNVNNATPEYYKAHLSKKCQATLVLESPALNEDGSQKTDKDGKAVNYTYTIYLTIEYVEGPNFTGGITIDNCALPGEMIRLKKDKVKISADQAFAPNGYFWHIGKLLKDKKGEFVKDDKGDIQFEDGSSWLLATTTSKDTYKQGDKIDKDRNDLFAGAKYDKTTDYLDIPAYYFMNGYGVQLGVTMTGIKETVFPVNIAPDDTLVVHNYHQMDPHKTGIDLHLSEAIERTQKESNFAEPRIYINDVSDLTAFINFVDTTKIQENAQFILQSDLTIPKGYDGSKIIFKGILHGNGHIIEGLGKDQSLFLENQGKIYNLGLTTGSIAAKGNTKGTSSTGEYHCCFEYAPASSPDTPIVYGWDGKKTEKSYTHDDFKYGKVAYDLNGYYLRAKLGNSSDKDKAELKYVYDYYANGDYQYAHRTDEITGNNTGITYLRKGQDSDQPNYGQTETRHDQTHKVDKARAIYTETTAEKPATFTGTYRPLLNENDMNDFLFWGQSLQSTPADYPAKIASQQNKYMTNRVYRTDAYYGNTDKDYFHYNAYKLDTKHMGTYVHIPTTTAINFAATDRDEPDIYDNLTIKDGVTQNLLVYTAADNESKDNEAYDIVHQTLSYDEKTAESNIKGHHIVKTGETYATPFLHLVERTANNENSEGETCYNNDFCVPLEFSVTKHAWYVRKPMLYAENTTGAWEGISLPFTVQKTEASLNGEITHFYGEENLHHEYWLRGLTGVNETEKKATFQRPCTGTGLFNNAGNTTSMNYTFHNTFFVDTYGKWLYNNVENPYYGETQTLTGYLPLLAGVPYIVRFPGEYYYEFDLSSKFYNSILNKKEDPQTITFHAYANMEPQKSAIVIPITKDMQTVSDGYAHWGTFAAREVANGGIYAINAEGTAFSNTATSQTVMPFRTYLTKESTNAGARSSAVPSVIRISETTGIDRIEPEINGNDDTPAGESLFIRPIGAHRVRIESTYATQLKVFSTTGQLYRILDVRPGTATYSGFPDGIYIFGKAKVLVK